MLKRVLENSLQKNAPNDFNSEACCKVHKRNGNTGSILLKSRLIC